MPQVAGDAGARALRHSTGTYRDSNNSSITGLVGSVDRVGSPAALLIFDEWRDGASLRLRRRCRRRRTGSNENSEYVQCDSCESRTVTISFDDPFLPLAFSLHSNPGAYAVLAGAGISRGAGLLTAWGVVTDLIDKIRMNRDPNALQLTEQTAGQWYEEEFGHEPDYSELLGHLGRTSAEREALLRGYFAPNTDGDADPVKPSAAHRAVANLMRHNIIRVVVTMNFDHLFEDALRDIGIEPVIVSTDGDAEGLRPLHTVDHCVIHLHGDYRNASSMLNTSDELATYKPHIQQLLTQIVTDHGLLIAGWSATYDRALRSTVAAHICRHFTPGWIEPHTPTAEAQQLITNTGAHLLPATADDALARLDDAVTAIRARQRRHPLTVATIITRIKRELGGRGSIITAHDTFTTEAARLETLDTLTVISYSSTDSTDYADRVAIVDEACRVPVAAIAVLARWGDSDTDEWWRDVLNQWTHAVRAGGTITWLELPLMVATRMFYAAGIAATAGRRYDLLARLFATPVHPASRQEKRACDQLAWHLRHQSLTPTFSNDMRTGMCAVLADALGLSDKRLNVVWQEFETLRTAALIITADTGGTGVRNALNKRAGIEGAQQQFQLEGEAARPNLRVALEEADKAMAQLARLAPAGRPHIHLEEAPSQDGLSGYRWTSAVARRLADHPEPFTKALASLAPTRMSDPAGDIACVMNATVTAFHLAAVTKVDHHTSVQELWLDQPMS